MDSQGVNDSWDFFDNPPGPQENEPLSEEQPLSKPPTRPKSAKPSNPPRSRNVTTSSEEEKETSSNRKSRRSRSSSGSSGSRSNSYSSVSDSDSKSKESPKRQGRKASRQSSRSSSRSDRSASRSRASSRSSRSRSRSYSGRDSKSGSDSDSRPSNPIAKSEGRLPHRGRSRIGEDEYSSSAYSDGDEDGTNKNNSQSSGSNSKRGVKRLGKRQAWSDEVSQEGSIKVPSSQARPKTAKGRKGGQRNRSRSQSEDSEALSDSDMTEVSSIDSPRNSKLKTKKAPAKKEEQNYQSNRMQFQAMPISEDDHDPDSHYEQQSSGLDLEILMKAVGELEKQKRLQENSRRVVFAPMSLKRSEKGNYTFDKSKTRDIERENQRLLKEIVRRVNRTGDCKTGERKSKSQQAAYKLTASAINRERDMKRIESENLAFLRRLQKVKPTQGISRDSQLQSYNSTTLHGVPMAALHPLPNRGGRRSAFEDSASSIGSRTRSMTSINSVVSSVRSGKSSRPGSRPSSATKRVDTRPQWSDRW